MNELLGICIEAKFNDEWYGRYYICHKCGAACMVRNKGEESKPKYCPDCGIKFGGDKDA